MNIKEAELLFHDTAKKLSKEKLHLHAIQFLEKKVKSQYRYSPLGSGVLIQIQDYYMVFTASHVIKDMSTKPLYVNTRIGVQRIIGSCHNSNLEVDEYVDLAYIILDKMFGLLLTETYQFLPLTKISHSHTPKETSNYMVCGYPENNIWEIEGDIYTGSSHFLLSMANEKIYDYYHLDRRKNYVLNFAGKGVDLETGKKSDKIEDPYGMSGCGLWFLQVRPGYEKMVLDYFLIGIMTTLKKYKYHVLIGNKIELIMADLEKTRMFNFDWQTLST